LAHSIHTLKACPILHLPNVGGAVRISATIATSWWIRCRGHMLITDRGQAAEQVLLLTTCELHHIISGLDEIADRAMQARETSDQIA